MNTAQAQSWPPDYRAYLTARFRRVEALASQPIALVGSFEYYKTRPQAFVDDWCVTFDPRNAMAGLPTKMPFILFERQRDLITFLYLCVMAEECGLIEKCRDMGATWVCAAFSVWLFLFWPGASVGWGSRKELLVDDLGNPDSIFEKMRMILNNLPKALLPKGWNPKEHMSYMRFVNPENGATITGESGDNIGRGGRKLIYFKDESAHYVHPESIEAALNDNTRCQIDISSVMGNTLFERKREVGVDWNVGQPIVKGRTNVFVMDWRDHPAKSDEWYATRRKKAEDDGLLHIFAREVDRDYAAAVEGVIIPPLWVKSAIDAHIKLKLDTTGGWAAALDVADEGGDTNALAKRKSIVLKYLEEWGERDTGVTARRAVAACMGLGDIGLQYDCIGVGAGVKAETNRLIEEGIMSKKISLVPWNAADGVQDPKARVIPDDDQSPLNEDFYQNFSAQAGWALRRRFELTHRAVTDPSFTWNVEDLISIDSTLPLLRKLEKELSQPTVGQSANLKMLINKKPKGSKSPNLFDAVKMLYFPAKPYEAPVASFGTYGSVGR